MKRISILLTVNLLMTACGADDERFFAPAFKPVKDQQATDNLAPQSAVKPDAKDDTNTEHDNKFIQKCLKIWENDSHPFKKDSSFRVMKSHGEKFGFKDKNKEDEEDKETDKPELVLVYPSFNLFKKKTRSLKNPKGWYCMISGFGFSKKTKVELKKGAKLAETKYDKDNDNDSGIDGVYVRNKTSVSIAD